MLLLGLRTRQAEEAARLVGDISEVDEAQALADDVEKVTVFPRRRVGPLAGGPFPALRTEQADVHGAPACVVDVADDPIAPHAPAVGEILTAHRLGLARETVCQIAGG